MYDPAYDISTHIYCIKLKWMKLVLRLNKCDRFISLCHQEKQQRLTEEHATVNDTLEIASGFIFDTESTAAEVNAMVQVRSTWLWEPVIDIRVHAI